MFDKVVTNRIAHSLGGTMRKLLATAAIAVLAVTGCTSGSKSGDSAGQSHPTTTAPQAATFDPVSPGVTADAIKVGITYVDLSKLTDIINIDHGDYRAAYTAVIDKLNASGGIDGR